MAVDIPEETGPAAVFASQVLIGTFLFALALLAAFGLDRLVAWMAITGAPPWMVDGAHIFEKLLFGLDFFLFALFL